MPQNEKLESYFNVYAYKYLEIYLFTRPRYVSGAYSFSDNLVENRPAWFGGTGIHIPSIYAIDGNHSTCIPVLEWSQESLVVDLGFHVNAALHGEIVVGGMYHILHSCAIYNLSSGWAHFHWFSTLIISGMSLSMPFQRLVCYTTLVHHQASIEGGQYALVDVEPGMNIHDIRECC